MTGLLSCVRTPRTTLILLLLTVGGGLYLVSLQSWGPSLAIDTSFSLGRRERR